MDVDDEELLHLVGKGDREAFDVLYARNASWLVLRLRRRCRDPELIREVLQETFLMVWRAAASYRGDGAAVGWLWSVAAGRLIDARRRALARPQSAGRLARACWRGHRRRRARSWPTRTTPSWSVHRTGLLRSCGRCCRRQCWTV